MKISFTLLAKNTEKKKNLTVSMEILSDTVFRGANVTLSGGRLTLNDGTSANFLSMNKGTLYLFENSTCSFSISTGGEIQTCGGILTNHVSTKGLTVDESVINFGAPPLQFVSNGVQYAHLNAASLGSSTICGGDDYAEILTTVNFDNMVGSKISKLKYESIPINFDVPADCTKFTVDVTGDFTYGNMLSARMMKLQHNVCFGVGQAQGYGASKFVDVDVWTPCTSIGKVLIEKSSSFAMSSADGYELKLIYY